MNRRRLLRAVSVCGGLGVAGCLESDTQTDSSTTGAEPYPRYDRPAYSEWSPAESYDGGGVVFAQLRLEQYSTVQQAIEDGRLDTSHPVVGLAVYGTELIATAVETLSAYPFGDALRQAVIAASTPDGASTADRNQTLVEPATDSLSPTNKSTSNETADNESTSNETADNESTSNETADNESTSNETADNESTSNETADNEEADPIRAVDLGIELDRVALIDEMLLFEGHFDRSQIIERFGDSFEQVDTHRGVSIYEGTDEHAGAAFALTGSRLLVPTVDSDRSVDGETVLAHILSGYISTLDRIVDTADGEWLFETTGPTALGVGFWNTPLDDHLAASDVPTDRLELDAVFDPVESCLSAVSATTENDRTTEFEARFSGLYPDGPPSDEDLQLALVGDREPQLRYSEPPRVHVTTTLGDL